MIEIKYWLPFQADSGDIWVEGPFGSREIALVEREHAKRDIRPPSKCGIPFPADTKEDAEKVARKYLI